MVSRICLIGIVLASLNGAWAAQAESPIGTIGVTHSSPTWLAVSPFDAAQGISSQEIDMMQQRLTTLLGKSGPFYVVPRAWPETAQMQQGGSSCGQDAACYRQIGEMMGLRWMLTGTVTEREGHLRIVARLVDLHTGKIAKEELHDCSCPLGGVLDRIAKNFSDDFAKHKNSYEYL